ncbi:hypothetical protein BH24ACT6_BH24ACT6_16710 [soil metagenome]
MRFSRRVGSGVRGFFTGIGSVPRDIRRYLAIRRM